MALPVFRAASAKSTGAVSTTPDLPAGSAADDIIILVAVTIDGETLSITGEGSVSPWTQIDAVTVGVGQELRAWWGRYASGSTGPTVATTGDHVCAATVGYSGCATSGSPIDVHATGTEETGDTSFSFATGISSTINDCLALCVASITRDSNTGSVPVMTNTSLSSLASRLNHCTNVNGGGGYGLSEGAKATAGTLGTFECTYATASAKSYIAFALKPPSGTTHEAAASLSGAGTLAALGTAILIGAAALAGTGTLGATAAVDHTGIAALSGVGTLTAAPSAVYAGAASLNGAGFLAASGTVGALVEPVSIGIAGALEVSACGVMEGPIMAGSSVSETEEGVLADPVVAGGPIGEKDEGALSVPIVSGGALGAKDEGRLTSS